MKMKKLVAGLLSAAMVFTSVSYNGYGVNQAEAAGAAVADETVKADSVTGVVEYKGTELVTNASANSWNVANSGYDRGPEFAFKDGREMWHSNYGNASNTNVDGKATAQNPIWIQTGFSKTINMTGFSYLGRPDNSNNRINAYKFYVSTSETKPTVDVTDTSVWTEAASGNMKDSDAPQYIKFSEPKQARWIRLVATSAHGNNRNWVTANRIRVYEQNTADVKLNNFGAFWDHEVINETMATQTEADRWHFEIKPTTGAWKDMSGTDFATGKWHTDDRWAVGDEHCRIQRDGFRGNLNNENAAYSITWVAPKDGYYKFKQVGTAGTYSLSGKLRLYKVDSIDASATKIGADKADGQPFDSGIHYMKKGDKFRFAAEKNGTGKLINYCDGNPKVNWEVADCSAKAYATQWLPSVNVDSSKPQALQNDVTELKAALQDLVNTSTSEAEIKDGIKALEDAIARMNNYTAMESVTFTNGGTHTLKVGENLNLTVKVLPAEYPEVKWTVTGATGVVSQDNTNKNQFTAVAPGTVKIKATSVYDEAKFAETTVIVKNDTAALEAAIAKANALLTAGNYTQASLDNLKTAITEAEGVRDAATATAKEIEDAVKALEEVMSSLVRTYTVKALYANNTEVATAQTGEYNKVVTFIAPEMKDNQKFAYWTFKGQMFSTSRVLTVAITGDAEYTAVYQSEVQQVVSKAVMADPIVSKNANGTLNVKFLGKIVLPEGATLVEAGMVYRGKKVTGMNELVANENTLELAGKAKKYTAATVNRYHQFIMNVNGVPMTKSVSAVVYAKVRVNGQEQYVYSDIATVTNN